MDYSFLSEIINKNWFQPINDISGREWSFKDDLKNLNEDELKSLLELILECLDLKTDKIHLNYLMDSLKKGISYKIEDIFVILDIQTLNVRLSSITFVKILNFRCPGGGGSFLFALLNPFFCFSRIKCFKYCTAACRPGPAVF